MTDGTPGIFDEPMFGILIFITLAAVGGVAIGFVFGRIEGWQRGFAACARIWGLPDEQVDKLLDAFEEVSQ